MFEISLLRELLTYDPETGLITNLVARNSRSPAGAVARCINGAGYVVIGIGGKLLCAHRVAWALHTGAWPVNQIDHINGIRTDNRFANLRDVSGSINQHNRRSVGRNSTTGFLGVTKRGRRYEAALEVSGKSIHVGNFRSAEEAHSAYLAAKLIHHPGCTS